MSSSKTTKEVVCKMRKQALNLVDILIKYFAARLSHYFLN